MNEIDLQTFMSVVHTGTFSEAAKELFTSQTTVSHRIRSLEAELGFSLFTRQQGVRAVELTPRGERFIPLAEHWMTLWDSAKVLGEESYRVPLYVCANHRLNTYVLPEYYTFFSQTQPQITLQISSHHSSDIIELVTNRQVDVGFISVNPNTRNLSVQPFLVEPLVMISAKDSVYPEEKIDPNTLDPKDEVQMIDNGMIQSWRLKHWNSYAQPFVRTDSFTMVARYLTRKNLWAICPLQIARNLSLNHDLSIREFDCEVPVQTSYVICHEELNETRMSEIDLFLEQFRLFCRKFGPSAGEGERDLPETQP